MTGECYPSIRENGLVGRTFDQDCEACGHLVGIHSRERGCVVCQIEMFGADFVEAMEAAGRTFEEKMEKWSSDHGGDEARARRTQFDKNGEPYR